MIASLTSDNVGDFNQRYIDTYGWLILEDGNKRFVHITDVTSEEVRFTSGGKLTYTAMVDSGVSFEFIPVDRGWFVDNEGKGWYLQRRVARQFKRGISPQNTQIFSLEGMEQYDVTYAILRNIFYTPQEYSYVPGASCVLSKFFAVYRNIVYFYNMRIGTIINNEVTFDDDLVSQEFQDMIRRNQYPIKVN